MGIAVKRLEIGKCPNSMSILPDAVTVLSTEDGHDFALCKVCEQHIEMLCLKHGDLYYSNHQTWGEEHEYIEAVESDWENNWTEDEYEDLDEYDKLVIDLSETVNMVAHYHGDSTMKYIEEFNLNFALGNVIKYVSRADSKGDPIEALEKARWYLDREILKRKRQTPESNPEMKTKA